MAKIFHNTSFKTCVSFTFRNFSTSRGLYQAKTVAPKLYYAPTSPPSQMILLVAKHLNLQLDLIKIHPILDEPTPGFLKANPARTIPALDDNGFCLAESRAIGTYLVEKYGKDDSLLPKNAESKALLLQRLFLDENIWQKSYVGIVRRALYSDKLPTSEDYKKLEDVLYVLNTYLQGSKWIAGNDITLADYSALVTLNFVEGLELADLKKFPNISSWLQRVKKEVKHFEETVPEHTLTLRERFVNKCEALKAQQ